MNPPRRTPLAFTLIEIVISLGILVFAFVSILGLLAPGLQLFRQAMDTTIKAQIIQSIMNEAQQKNFVELADLQAAPFYFDNEGQRLTTAQQTDAIYRAAVTIGNPTALPAATAASTENVATVVVRIFKNLEVGGKSQDFSAYVANTDAKPPATP